MDFVCSALNWEFLRSNQTGLLWIGTRWCSLLIVFLLICARGVQVLFVRVEMRDALLSSRDMEKSQMRSLREAPQGVDVGWDGRERDRKISKSIITNEVEVWKGRVRVCVCVCLSRCKRITFSFFSFVDKRSLVIRLERVLLSNCIESDEQWQKKEQLD